MNKSCVVFAPRAIRYTLCLVGAMLFALGVSSAFLCALSLPVQAQQPGKVLRIGYLYSGAKPSIEAIQRELRELGYLEGKNVVSEDRDVEGQAKRFPALAAELVRRNVDIIVAVNELAARAAKNSTQTIPIVMVRIGTNPVETGLVESLARPGGNITGVAIMAVELTGKRLELFKEALPKLTRVDALYDPTIRGNVQEAKHVQSTGRAFGLDSKSWEVRGAGDFEKVFALLGRTVRMGSMYPVDQH